MTAESLIALHPPLQAAILTAAATLVGVFLAAFLAFWIRFNLDRRARRDEDQRLAFIQLVTCVQFVAVGRTVREMYEKGRAEFSPEQLQTIATAFGGKAGAFTTEHSVCVFLAEVLSTPAVDMRALSPGLAWPLKGLRRAALEFKEQRLSNEELTRLPRSVIPAYLRLQGHMVFLGDAMELWAEWLAGNAGREWITAEVIHNQWRLARNVYEEAEHVAASLKRFGADPKNQIEPILGQFMEDTRKAAREAITNTNALKAAMAEGKSRSSSSPDAHQ